MKLSAINLGIVKNNIVKNKQTNNKVTLNNNFQFSFLASNAIRANAIGNISFCSLDKITQADVDDKRNKLYEEAIEVWNEKNRIYNEAEACLQEANLLSKEALKDYFKEGPFTYFEMGIEDGALAKVGFSNYDSLGNILYSAKLRNGNFESVVVYDNNGKEEKTISFDRETGDIVSILIFKDKGVAVEYTYKKDDNGQLVPSEYIENQRVKHNGAICIDKLINFLDSKSCLYQVNVSKKSGYFKAFSCEKEFEFSDLGNFTYTLNNNSNQINRINSSGEVIVVDNYNITSWSEGYISGAEKHIERPKIILKDGKIIERHPLMESKK